MKLYRAIVENLCNDEDYLKSEIYLTYKEFEVIRQTECFFVIKINGKEKKIGKLSRNQFATFTKQKALKDAWYRNRMYRSILDTKIKHAERVRDFIKNKIDTQK